MASDDIRAKAQKRAWREISETLVDVSQQLHGVTLTSLVLYMANSREADGQSCRHNVILESQVECILINSLRWPVSFRDVCRPRDSRQLDNPRSRERVFRL